LWSTGLRPRRKGGGADCQRHG